MKNGRLVLVVALALGCGGEASEPAAGAESSSGGEDVQATPDATADAPMDEAMDQATEEPEPEPEPTGPAHLTVTVKVGTDEVALPVRVLNADGEEVAQGDAGQPFTLPAGDYTVAVAVTDAHVLADTPEQQEEVSLAPAEQRDMTMRFLRARVRLHVRRNGRELRRARVELRRAGSDETVADFRTGNDYVPVTAGRYNLLVHAARQEITVNDVIFTEGSSRDMPIDIN